MVCVQRMVGFHNFLYTASKELLFATYYTLEILVFFYSMINQIQCKYKDIIIVLVCSGTRYLMENYAICCAQGDLQKLHEKGTVGGVSKIMFM